MAPVAPPRSVEAQGGGADDAAALRLSAAATETVAARRKYSLGDAELEAPSAAIGAGSAPAGTRRLHGRSAAAILERLRRRGLERQAHRFDVALDDIGHLPLGGVHQRGGRPGRPARG